MKSHLNISTPSPQFFFFFFKLLLILIHFPSYSSTSNTTNWYSSCNSTFNCGEITGVDYPFWGGYRPKQCGHPDLHLNCNNTLTTTITIFNLDYRVLQIDQLNQILTIKRNDLAMGDICPEKLINTTIESSLFAYASTYVNLTIQYGCPSLSFPLPLPVQQELTCTINGTDYQNNYIVPGAHGPGLCRASIVIPVQTVSFTGIGEFSDIVKLIEGGFDVRWKVNRAECDKCKSAGGRCGFDLKWTQFACVCPESDQPPEGNGSCSGSNFLVNSEPSPQPLQSHHHLSPASVSKGGSKGTSTSIVLPVVGAVIAGIGFGWLVFYCRQRRKRLVVGSRQSSITDKKELPTTPLTNKEETIISPSVAFTKSVPKSYPSTLSEFGRDTSYFGAKVFSCTELEEATENFAESRELGDGGFGAVYYGKLADGRIVAVKRLYENNYKRVEQFMNEVEILTRLRHVNLVTLYGCTSKKSKDLLLVYEYVPNGTVADHLHGKRANSRLLSWPVRLNIAIETANGLAYLHASDIIHRDVKTNNILLDNDFHVKVADFGLVRLFPNDATHVSTAPQGTPGYVDPDYYQSYQLTEKSDVYSFGVVLIELISSLQAVDTNRNRHEVNLSNMAINKIQNHTLHELVDPNLQFEANTCVKRMITLVAELAFRCLQQEKDMRPSMQEVLDTLLGIKNGVSDSEKVQVLSIIVDDGHLLKDNNSPFSPDSVITNKWVSGSTKNSSG